MTAKDAPFDERLLREMFGDKAVKAVKSYDALVGALEKADYYISGHQQTPQHEAEAYMEAKKAVQQVLFELAKETK